jgi:serine/threonine protein kinase
VINREQDKYIAMDIPYVDSSNLSSMLALTKPRHRLLVLMEGYRVLLDALSQLLKIRIVHFDLKEGNVLYARENALPLVADFGISLYNPSALKIKNGTQQALKPLREYFYVYTTDYRVWCLDIVILSWIATELSWSKEAVDIIREDYEKRLDRLDYMTLNMRTSWLSALDQQLTKYRDMGIVELVNYLLDQWDSWDSYSVGVMYVDITTKAPENQQSIFLERWRSILEKCISPIPERRLSPEDTKRIYNDLFLLSDDPEMYIALAADFSRYEAYNFFQHKMIRPSDSKDEN